jgi:tetratricopeptide (TPR) repeat protein
MKTRSLSTLGTLLGDRFLAIGEISDTDESIETLKEAEKRMPKTHFERPGALGNLGVRFGDRYTRTGSVEDLDASVEYTRLASETTPRKDVNWAPRLSNLAARLGERYTMIGRAVDLDEAIRIGHELITLPNLYHTNHSVYLNNLALRLNDRYGRTGLLSDLQKAVSHAQRSVDALPEDHTDVSARLRTLSSLLHERYRKTESEADFDYAMDITNVAVKAASVGDPSYPACLNNKGILLFNRFYVKKRQEDLIETIGLFRKAVEFSPENHAQRADRQRYLGDALYHMYTYDKNLQILDEAILCHRAASSQANTPIGVRLRATRHLLQSLVLKGDWQTAFESAKGALDLVPQLVLRSLDNQDKQYLLTQVAGLACEATSMAIQVEKDPITAIKVLEQGRGILSTSINDMRIDIEDLRESYPELATEFTQSKEDLERLGRTT